MKGYKAFNKGLVCQGKQYEVGKTFEEEGKRICEAGVMHFCETPFDVLDYYPLIDDKGDFTEFAEVEASEPILRQDNKCATNKLHIKAKISFFDFIKAGIDFLIETTKTSKTFSKKINERFAQIGSSGYGAQIGSSGDGAQIGSSGDGAKIGSSGDGAQIGSSGDGAQIGSSGYGAKIGSSGDGAKIGSSGYGAKIGSSGYGAKIKSEGSNCVICCAGHNSIVSAKKGSWITLAEWACNNEGKLFPRFVKTVYVDGKKIKEDTNYILKNGKFLEVK